MLIKTPRFTLRPYSTGDAESIVKHFNDKSIARNTLSIPYPYTLKDARDWIRMAQNAARRKNRTAIHFAIEIDGEVVGGIGIFNIHGHKAEIGYSLGRAYRGRGIMTRVVKEVSRYGFTELGLRRIYAIVMPHNKASMRVLEKAGHKFEAVMRKFAQKGDRLIDMHLYAKIR